MSTWSERFEEELNTLRTVRDELRVQIHLGAAEAKERWEELEVRFEHLEGRARQIELGSRESLDDIREAARALVQEIRDGYQHVRKLL